MDRPLPSGIPPPRRPPRRQPRTVVRPGVVQGFYLLEELGYPQNNILLNEDNQACLHLVENPATVGRAKHLELKMYFIRECVQSGLLVMQYCPIATGGMIADVFTKPLLEKTFIALRALFNVKF